MSVGRFVVVLAAATLGMLFGCGNPSRGSHDMGSHPGGVGRGSVLPVPLGLPSSPSASPAPFERIPYALPPGPEAMLWLYDRASQDILVYPGAGVGIENVFEWNPNQFYYDDRRDIFLLDSPREVRITLVEGIEVGGFAFSPVFDGQNNLYFLGTGDPDLADSAIGDAYVKHAPRNGTMPLTGIATESATGVGQPFPVGPILGKPIYLARINAVGRLHGGISSLNVTGSGDWVVFTTADGGLYIYDTRHVEVQALIAEQEISGGHASSANIDPVWGRFVVWQDSLRRSIFVLDRWTGQIDPVPFVAIAWNAETVGAPNFYGSDPYDVVLLVTLSGGAVRLMSYNLLTEQLTNLTLLTAIARGR